MLKMLTQHMRSKRATDDIFELGDRLTEKLKSEQQKCKLNSAMPHAFSKSSILSTKTSKLMSTPWLNQFRGFGRQYRALGERMRHCQIELAFLLFRFQFFSKTISKFKNVISCTFGSHVLGQHFEHVKFVR